MTAAAMAPDVGALAARVQEERAQTTGARTKRVYAKRVPSVLTPERRREAVLEVRAGRSVHQVAYDKSVAECVVLELWLRDIEKRLAMLARPAAMTAYLLFGVAGWSAWSAWQGQAQACPTLERSFARNGRARKRGLEDGSPLVALRVETPAAA